MFTDDLDEAIYQARLAALRRDEHIRAEGAINALDVAEPRIRELEAEAQRLNAMIAELREENAVFVDASRRLAALEAENGRLKAPVSHEEWQDYGQPLSGMFDKLDRAGVNRIIAARAQQPNPAQDKEQPMKEVKALAVMTRPELEKALAQMNVTRHDMHKLLELQQERIAELEKALLDADHLCKWLLQSDISEADRDRVIRDNGIAFALIIAQPEPRP